MCDVEGYVGIRMRSDSADASAVWVFLTSQSARKLHEIIRVC
jgi:hypothetical protein